eukprot:14554838-Alexandrium_andersonii.AAC.1
MAASPCHVQLLRGSSQHRASGLAWLQTGKRIGILEHAAQQCIWQMPLPMLQKLLRSEQIEAPKGAKLI